MDEILSLTLHVWHEDEWRWCWTIRDLGGLVREGSCASRESATQTMLIALNQHLNPQA